MPALPWCADRVEAAVESDEAGAPIVRELDDPGWLAEVDRQPARILRTNVLFRSARVSGPPRRGLSLRAVLAGELARCLPRRVGTPRIAGDRSIASDRLVAPHTIAFAHHAPKNTK
jgi:hypothetical protein